MIGKQFTLLTHTKGRCLFEVMLIDFAKRQCGCCNMEDDSWEFFDLVQVARWIEDYGPQ